MKRRTDKEIIDEGFAAVKRNIRPVMRKVGQIGTHAVAAGILSSHPVGAFIEGTLYGAKLDNRLKRMGRQQEIGYASERAALSEAAARKRNRVREMRERRGMK